MKGNVLEAAFFDPGLRPNVTLAPDSRFLPAEIIRASYGGYFVRPFFFFFFCAASRAMFPFPLAKENEGPAGQKMLQKCAASTTEKKGFRLLCMAPATNNHRGRVSQLARSSPFGPLPALHMSPLHLHALRGRHSSLLGICKKGTTDLTV